MATGLKHKTPIELWTGRKPNINHIRIFGSDVMVQVPKEKRHKFDRKSKNVILVGFCDNIKGYRLYDTQRKQILTSRDVIIIEKEQKVSPNLELTDSVEEAIQETNNYNGSNE